MRSYLANKRQRCKIYNSFSEWAKISSGAPQGSILGLLLFNIFVNDIFLFLQKCDQANYTDDSTVYTSGKRVSTIIDYLKHQFTILSKWFYNNFMVLKGTLMQIWKPPYMFVFIWKQYPEKFAFLLLRILGLFAREVCKFLKN